MKFADAKAWVEERSAAVVGVRLDETSAGAGVSTDVAPETLHRAMMSGLLPEGEVLEPLVTLGGHATLLAAAVTRFVNEATRAAHELEGDARDEAMQFAINGAICTIHGGLVQALALGMKLQEGR